MPPMTTTLFPYTTLFRSVRELFGFLQNPPFVLCTFMLQKFLLNPCPWRDTVINIEVEAHFVDCFEQCERSEEHTSELQSRGHLVCRLLLEKKKLSVT